LASFSILKIEIFEKNWKIILVCLEKLSFIIEYVTDWAEN